MSIAITDDHRALAETAADFLTKRSARGDARALLEAPEEGLPSWWGELADLGGGPNQGHARGSVFNALQYRDDRRSLIEDATGGGGDDRLTGNAGGNRLFGGGGDDHRTAFHLDDCQIGSRKPGARRQLAAGHHDGVEQDGRLGGPLRLLKDQRVTRPGGGGARDRGGGQRDPDLGVHGGLQGPGEAHDPRFGGPGATLYSQGVGGFARPIKRPIAALAGSGRPNGPTDLSPRGA